MKIILGLILLVGIPFILFTPEASYQVLLFVVWGVILFTFLDLNKK